MTFTPEQLQTWMKSEEDEHLEFKEAKAEFKFKDLARYCAAIANEHGGKLILGVTDKRPRKVVGSLAFQNLNDTKARLLDKLHIRVDAETIPHPDGRVVVFNVPSRPIGAPIHCEGAYLMRSGRALVSMTSDQLKAIFNEAGPDFSYEICPQASVSDLDPDAIEIFRSKWIKNRATKLSQAFPLSNS